MRTLSDQLSDLQLEFQELHRNYNNMPQWVFMAKSVSIVDRMRLLEQLIDNS